MVLCTSRELARVSINGIEGIGLCCSWVDPFESGVKCEYGGYRTSEHTRTYRELKRIMYTTFPHYIGHTVFAIDEIDKRIAELKSVQLELVTEKNHPWFEKIEVSQNKITTCQDRHKADPGTITHIKMFVEKRYIRSEKKKKKKNQRKTSPRTGPSFKVSCLRATALRSQPIKFNKLERKDMKVTSQRTIERKTPYFPIIEQ